MINSTNIKIPKKYEHMIDSIYKDEDGYWAYSKNGHMFELMECHTAHEDTQAELLRVIKSLKPCECDDCIMGLRN